MTQANAMLSPRLANVFSRCREEKRAAFIAFICGGDPDFATSLEICRTLINSGVDILEVGVPFSDPLADGLTNQLAAQRALESGMTSSRVFDLVRAIRDFSELPIVLYTYYNLVFTNGVEAYAEKAKAAGVDGLLTLDLPPEEADELLAVSKKHGLANVFIAAPTSSEQRLELISKAASGFIYYVSREGVTGVRDSLPSDLGASVARVRRHTSLPLVVGFGISTPAQVAEVGSLADGVVVGSAFVNLVRDHLSDRNRLLQAMEEKARLLTGALTPAGD